MEMILRLNLVYLQHAHKQGLRTFEQVRQQPMPPHQLIIKLRPDALPAMETWFALEDLQKIAERQPDVFFTSYHPVWGIERGGRGGMLF